jgi:glycosyltransferase involved in cell wall biosynthesis
MKVLVFSHHLELGGSQVNAIELAAAVRDTYGHDVAVFATPGPAVELVRAHGLRFIAAPTPRMHPSPTVIGALRQAVRSEAADLVHAWEWPQCLDAFYGIHLLGGVPMVGSNMSMAVTRFLPRSIPLTYGTPALVEQARHRRPGQVVLLEPPVDTERNRPHAIDTAEFRERYGLIGRRRNLVIVSRLVAWMKLEGIERSMAAVARLAREVPVRLVVVGGGPAHDRLNARAAEINRRLGDRVVVLTGPMTDPRPAYAVADVVLGMGSSILRGMAFAKPCVVLGEGNFSDVFTPQTSDGFLRRGFFGLGNNAPSADHLHNQLKELLADEGRLRQLGTFSRHIVEERFSLELGARTLDGLYRTAFDRSAPRLPIVLDAVRTGVLRAAAHALPRSARQLWRWRRSPAGDHPMSMGQVSDALTVRTRHRLEYWQGREEH